MRDFFYGIKDGVLRLWYKLTGKAEKQGDSNANGTYARIADTSGDTRLFDSASLKHSVESHGRQAGETLFVERAKKPVFAVSVAFSTLRMLIFGIVIVGIAAFGAFLGVAKAYIDTAPAIDEAQLTKSARTSFLYDKDGVLITSLANIEYRDWVDIEDIPLMLQYAFVSVEDVRFYEHNGVDIKRLFSAALEVLGNTNSSGGSTITQQLIKNKILTSERTYKRKIQEAYLATILEDKISKDKILEAYLNDIHLGESNYGVKTAAKDYFGKELNELTARECAMLAGLTTNPYYYNPRLNKYKRTIERWEETEKRTDSVLYRMYQAGFLEQSEYERAIEEEVYILELSEQRQMYDMPYFVEYAIRDVVTHLLIKRELPDTRANRSAIENEIRTGGYNIYTTVDTNMQHIVQDTLAEWDNYPQLANPQNDTVTEQLRDGEVLTTIQPQSSAVVVDYHTGELRAIVGGRNSPTILKGTNRAYQSYMEVGSSIKPLAVYGPALDMGASPATIIGNFPAPIEGWNAGKGYPYIGDEKYIGPTSIRRGIVSSLNVVAARTLMERVGPELGAQYLINMGAAPSEINADGSGLALGTSGLTTIQMASAFGTFGNLGEYLEPISFTKVVDGEGNIVIDAREQQVKRQVYKQSTAYMMVDMLTDAVNSGTGTTAKIKGMTVAGKTGTNSDYKSVYFAGLTPYYAASVWVGHDKPTNVLKSGSSGKSYGAPLWQAFMEKIHEGLPDKSIIDASPSSLGLVKKRVCSVSGMLATEACEVDSAGHLPITDWFFEPNAPTIPCNMHAAVSVCDESGQIAAENCPATSVVSASIVLITPGSYYDQFTDEELRTGLRNYERTMVTLEEYVAGMTPQYNRCMLHSGSYYDTSGETEYTLQELRTIAQQLYADIEELLSTGSFSSSVRQKLENSAYEINYSVMGADKAKLERIIANAREAIALAQAEQSGGQPADNGTQSGTGQAGQGP